MFHLFLALTALLFGSLILSLVYEGIAGHESFSPPFANIFLVLVVGAVLYGFFGFKSTLIVLGLYAA